MIEENLNYMDKLELDIFLESFLNNLMDLYNIDVIKVFTESEGTLQSGAKIVTFFDKIITGIKEFIQKIKNMINKKIKMPISQNKNNLEKDANDNKSNLYGSNSTLKTVSYYKPKKAIPYKYFPFKYKSIDFKKKNNNNNDN